MDRQRNDLPDRYQRRARTAHQQRSVEGAVRDQRWPGNLMAVGIFAWLVSFFWVVPRTLIGYDELYRWFALFAFIGNLAPYARSGRRMGMERLEWFLFNLLAVGPLTMSLLLWLNYGAHGPVRWYVVEGSPRSIDVRRHWAEQGELPPHQPFLEDGEREATPGLDALTGGNYARLGVAKGALGYDVITHWAELGTPPWTTTAPHPLCGRVSLHNQAPGRHTCSAPPHGY